jgi:hypothetical protein
VVSHANVFLISIIRCTIGDSSFFLSILKITRTLVIVSNMSSTSDSPRFLTLAFEIRQLIYRHLFKLKTIVLGPNDRRLRPREPATIASILRTCKQCHNEAEEIFYAVIRFRLSIRVHTSLLKERSHNIIPLRRLHHLAISGSVPDSSLEAIFAYSLCPHLRYVELEYPFEKMAAEYCNNPEKLVQDIQKGSLHSYCRSLLSTTNNRPSKYFHFNRQLLDYSHNCKILFVTYSGSYNEISRKAGRINKFRESINGHLQGGSDQYLYSNNEDWVRTSNTCRIYDGAHY